MRKKIFLVYPFSFSRTGSESYNFFPSYLGEIRVILENLFLPSLPSFNFPSYHLGSLYPPFPKKKEEVSLSFLESLLP